MTKPIIAVIAEDETDCNTIKKVIHRVLGEDIKIKHWASKGCSALKKKLTAQMKELSRRGCNVFVIIHDLDRNPQTGSLNDDQKLRKDLESKIFEDRLIEKNHICIPIEELEAWFWSDPEVVAYIGQDKGKAHPNPHQIRSPKEKLIALSKGENRKPRYSTNMNPELADKLNFELCSARCPSFKNLLNFLQSL
jgi:hypothetical protein